MKRSLSFLVLSSLLILGFARPAAAQVLGTTTNGAYPLVQFTVYLSAGSTYQFETRNLTAGGSAPADTVLTLRRSGAPNGEAAIAGADGCGGVWERSCFSAAITTSGTYHLMLRAWTTPTYGQCEVRMSGPSGLTSLGTVSFGGATVAHSMPWGTTSVRFETAHRPGRVPYHSLWIVPPGRPDWDIRYAANANSTRTNWAGAIDVSNATTAALATGSPGLYTYGSYFYYGNIGDVALIYNQRSPALDYDGDGLSSALEASLRTCDTPTGSTANGWPCANVGAVGQGVCAAYPSFPNTAARDLCRAALRDTDFDGLQDDLETFGYGAFPIGQWGATPVHHDVFVEMDTLDQDPTIDTAGIISDCDGFQPVGSGGFGAIDRLGDDDNVPSMLDPSFLDSISAVYGAFPGSHNPDWVPGIRIHYDLGINSVSDPRETRYGAWGGGGTCIPAFDADPDPLVLTPVNCNYIDVYNNNPSYIDTDGNQVGCPTDPPGGAMNPSRKWLFMWSLDGPVSGGGQTGGSYYGASDAAEHAHEFGHVATLGHSGPLGSYRAYADHAMGFGMGADEGNLRPNHLSRMDYLYERVGGSNGASASGSTSLFRAFSFGRGTLAPMNHRVMSEIAPFPGVTATTLAPFAEIDPALGAYPERVARVRHNPAGADVDWNRDGVWAGSTTVNAPSTLANVRMLARRRMLTPLTSLSTTFDVTGNSATMVNGVLLLANRRVTGSTRVIEVRADSDQDCNALPLGPTSAYPGCFEHGTTFSMPATIEPLVGASMTSFDSGSSTTAVVAATVSLTGPTRFGIRFSRLTVTPNAGASEASITPTAFLPPVAAIAPALPYAGVGLAQYSASEVLAAIVGTNGRVQTFRYNPATGAMTIITDAVIAGGGFINPATSPTLVAVGEQIYMALSGGDPSVRVFELNRASNEWILRLSVNRFGIVGTTVTLGAPLVNLVQDLEGERLRVDFLGFTSGPGAFPFSWSSGLLSGSSPFGTGTVDATATTFNTFTSMAAVWDGRSAVSEVGDLRVYYVSRTSANTSIELRPFAVMGDPAVLPDYDEMVGLQHGFCYRHSLMASSAPSVPLWGGTSYNYGVPSPTSLGRCGALPQYEEAPLAAARAGMGVGELSAEVESGGSDEGSARAFEAATTPTRCDH